MESKITKEIIDKKYVLENINHRDIAIELNVSDAAVRKAIRRYGYKVKPNKTGPKLNDLIGKRFGRLVVLKLHKITKDYSFYKCKCDCGKTKIFRRDALLSGTTNSCGCFRREEHIKRLKKLRKGKDTYIEKIIESLLKTLKIKIKKQFIIKNTSIADFYLPDHNLLIYCDGDYWHSNKFIKRNYFPY